MVIKPNLVLPLFDYPNKLLERENTICLNGLWDFAILKTDDFQTTLKGTIKIPYCIESHLSQVKRKLNKNEYLHLRTSFILDKESFKGRVLLNIGAMDQRAKIFINRTLVCQWTKPYLPLIKDITRFLKLDDENELYIVCMDDTENEFYQRGLQSVRPAGKFHSSISGIWQSVFLENVSENYIKNIKIDTNYDAKLCNFTFETEGKIDKITIDIFDGDLKLVTLNVTDNQASYRFTSFKAWTPQKPFLYNLVIHTKHETIHSYFGMRKVGKTQIEDKEIFTLNNRPFLLQGTILKGYYPLGLYTPQNYDDFKNDIIAIKNFGFNAIRLNGKIESPMFYYLCDKLGLMILQDIPSGGLRFHNPIIEKIAHFRFDDTNYKNMAKIGEKSRDNFLENMILAVKNLYNHPSVIGYSIFDEGMGQFDSKKLTMALKGIDNTRIVDSASGFYDQGGGDIYSIHQNNKKPKLENDHKRMLMLTSFGNFNLYLSEYCLGKEKVTNTSVYNQDELSENIHLLYKIYLDNAIKNEGLCGYFYNQFIDIESECNGLLTYDRKYIKCDYAKIKNDNKDALETFNDVYNIKDI